MNKKVLQTLEFMKIIEQLEMQTTSELGRERCRNLEPMTELEIVQEAQAETDEAVTVYRVKGHVPIGALFDIRPHVKRAEIGGILNPQELLEIATVVQTTRSLVKFFKSLEAVDVKLPILYAYQSELMLLNDLEKEIKYAIGDGAEILDSASEKLRLLRKQLRTAETQIREKFDSIVRSANAAKMLSDAIVTIRNDRFVIPVKQEYRNHYGGVVHDQSASGQTLFIEPQTVMQLNNNLQDLKVKEQIEIERILSALTAIVADYCTELLTNIDILAYFDFVFAKAKYGKLIKGSKPEVNDQGMIKLKKARHPLISPTEIVANDISLGDNYSSIVITGPNTGGKTVMLKTVGLCTLMTMAGLQVPALDGSVVSIFKKVFADIGDEQSIEQSLSTFSSHMVNIVAILEDLDARSLVLYDELGAGTDPQEGAALAIAILDESQNRGARVIATTHYPELKAYSYNRDHVMNASMEFDVETLSPTYRLLLGIPGKSNAFEISRKLGMSERILTNAKKMIGAETNQIEKMITSLEQARNQAELDRVEANSLLKNAKELQTNLHKETLAYQEKKEKLYEKARLEAKQIVEQARTEADKVIRDLHVLRLNKHAEVKEHELIEARRKLDEAVPKTLVKGNLPAPIKKIQLTAGAEVKSKSLNQKGFLIEKTSENEWLVQMGIMKIKLAETDLDPIASQKQTVKRQVTHVKGNESITSFSLDLRGERYEEALRRVEKFVDDAMLAGYPSISIIHGHGTGALRQGVRQYLQKHRGIKSIRFGGQGEGGLGVTIAELK